MFKVDYFKRRNGEIPCQQWLDSADIDPKSYAQLMAKIGKLESHGAKLFKTTMLTRMSETELCELTNGDYRILVYYEHLTDTFWLLNGFRKTKQNQREKVSIGKALLAELKEMRGL